MRKPDIRGWWAMVTGADSGIGLCFSRELARRGCNVVMVSNVADRLEKAAADVAREFGVQTKAVAADLTEPGAEAKRGGLCHLLDCSAKTGACQGAPDTGDNSQLSTLNSQLKILINNAGIFSFRELVDVPEEKVDAFVDLHCRAVTHLSRHFAARMAGAGGGYILNMSSMSCWTPMPGLSLYAATKAYIRVLSRSLHYEMRPRGVRVMVACPGGIATDLFGLPEKLKRLAVRLGALVTPERFTRRALDRMLRGRMQYVNGPLNRLGILAVGLTPTCVRMLVKKRLLDKGITR